MRTNNKGLACPGHLNAETSRDLFKAPCTAGAAIAIPNRDADGVAIKAFQFDFPG